MERARSATPPPAGVRGAGRMGKEERVRSPADFDRLRRDGRRGGDDVLRVLVARNGLAWPRLGCAISRKVGSAVVRNRLRRLYGAAFRAEKGNLPGVDVLLTPTRGAEDPTLDAVRGSLVRLVQQAASKLPPGPPAPPPRNDTKPERPETPEGRKGPKPKAKRPKARGPKKAPGPKKSPEPGEGA